MIPSLLAREIRLGLNDYLRTTFPVTSPFFKDVFDEFLGREDSLFRGPYVLLGLPFTPGRGSGEFFPEVPLGYRPHLHQERAFARLAHPRGRSSVVATGTGSGKTECFLWPVLDYCRQRAGERGIKAVLIYPMNALASDQAQRVARAIHSCPALRGRVTAGLYVGSDPEDKLDSPVKSMTPDGVITCRHALRQNPPDILLTNYKMLDFLLLRPADRELWRYNGPETLRYLVVDELHTFDGAQGTDLACLIRRLKARLDTPAGYLCCASTSATLGEREDARTVLDYASSVFGEPFDDDALITEERLSAGEFLERDMAVRFDLPAPSSSDDMDPERFDSPEAYLRRQAELWFGQEGRRAEGEGEDDYRVRVGDLLRGHVFFQNFLKSLGGRPVEVAPLLDRLAKVAPALGEGGGDYASRSLHSLLSLASMARRREGGRLLPLVTVQLQAWFREMRRMVVSVPRGGESPSLLFSDDLKDETRRRALPAVHCRDCGAMGWVAAARDGSVEIADLKAFYSAFFGNSNKIRFLFPSEAGAEARGLDGITMMLCPECMSLESVGDACSRCGERERLPVFVPNSNVARTYESGESRIRSRRDCPFCGAPSGLTLVGARSATLSSVMISQAMTSRGNDDKKMLAFTDSVQDAAHHAGFFGARTYRFTLRSAMARFLADGGDGTTLEEFAKGLPSYWSSRLPVEEFVSLFIAPNQTWRRGFALMKEGEPPGPDFMDMMSKRMGWEAYTEFGLNSHIGRTLEKSGVATASPDRDVLTRSAALLREALVNELPRMKPPTDDEVLLFLAGLVQRMKGKGAIWHPALDWYVRGGGNSFMISTQKIGWMPAYGRMTRRPLFASTGGRGDFDRIVPEGGRNWFAIWTTKCFGEGNPLMPTLAADFWRIVLAALSSERSGLLRRMEASDRGREQYAWGIEPSALRVTGDVAGFRCDECGAALYWGGGLPAGMPCARGSCGGRMVEADRGRDYYGRLYSTGDVCRLYPAEHTGLLAKGERTALEASFKRREGRRPWDPNLLSCTPTLEMGIDIGDLSTLMLCSMPPEVSSFRQRTGRAGRRDGNSLALTVARGRPHDLYFFAEPMNMIAGGVSPPGVFLGASAVLERQFAAFCLDCFARDGVAPGDLPDRASAALSSLDRESGFPHSFLGYVDRNRTELLDRFFALFGREISDDVKGHIERFASSQEDGLPFRLIDGLRRMKKQRDSLRRRAQTVRNALMKMKEDPAAKNEEVVSLAREKRALERLFRELGEMPLFNLLTDEGLVPNYAFPESGVTLRSVIYRKGEDGAPESDVYKYERAAASALRELAPESVFYAGGRKARIEQVDMTLSEVEEWRFCDSCSYMAPERADVKAGKCPRCGSSGFGDLGQRRKLLRMRQVFAYGGDRETLIADDSDDRETVFYTDQTMVNFDRSDVKSAWRSEGTERPFGFEYISRVVLREVNFGRMDDSGEQVRIDGSSMARRGFLICRHCGMVQGEGKERRHASVCPARNREKDDDIIDCVYLYRELQSEALRILLPAGAATERDIRTFTAALQLGLKRYFKGDTGHLRCTVHQEPQDASGQRRTCLLVYDSVPGGTGYLKQLGMAEGELMNVLRKALDVLRSCPCAQDSDKDGCYLCIYAYGASFYMKDVSRRRAVELLEAALEHGESMLRIDTVSSIEVNPAFDSELEALFAEAFRRAARACGGEMVRQIINGKSGYYIRRDDVAWYLEPQVKFGGEDGVGVHSRADFVLRPARSKDGFRPVAVFTDGYAFHRDRPGLDSAQRMALLRTGEYWVWSITWKDVKDFMADSDRSYSDPLSPVSWKGMEGRVAALDGGSDGFFSKYHGRNDMELLVSHILFPREASPEEWRLYARYRAMMMQSPEGLRGAVGSEALRGSIGSAMRARLPEWAFEFMMEEGRTPVVADRGMVRVCCSIDRARIGMDLPDSLRVAVSLDDGEGMLEDDWRAFLRGMNLFQFVEGASFFAVSGVESGEYEALRPVAAPFPVIEPDPGEARQWREAFDLLEYREGMWPVFEELRGAGWPAPSMGVDVAGESGEVLAQPEVAWPERRIALLTVEGAGDGPALEAAGWRVFQLEDIAGGGASPLLALHGEVDDR